MYLFINESIAFHKSCLHFCLNNLLVTLPQLVSLPRPDGLLGHDAPRIFVTNYSSRYSFQYDCNTLGRSYTIKLPTKASVRFFFERQVKQGFAMTTTSSKQGQVSPEVRGIPLGHLNTDNVSQNGGAIEFQTLDHGVKHPIAATSLNYKNAPPKRTFLGFSQAIPWQEHPDRVIIPNVPDLQLPNNKIQTSKYTWLTFLPKNLIEQFSKYPNLYFLVIILFTLLLFLFASPPLLPDQILNFFRFFS